MAQIKQTCRGEHTYSSDFSDVPNGALIFSKNVNYDRPGILTPREGYKGFLRLSSLTNISVVSIMTASDDIYVHFVASATKSVVRTSASAIATMASTADLLVGMSISGTGIPVGTTILSIDTGLQITMSNQASSTTTGSIDFIGYFLYGTSLTPSIMVTQVQPPFVDADFPSTWSTSNGNYHPTIKMIEAQNKNYYFMTNKGLFKVDDVDVNPYLAGMPRALDLGGALTAVSSGFMGDDTAVAYRIVWAKKDANDNLILSAPSGRLVIENSSGNSEDVLLNFTIPDGIDTTCTYQVYRSAQTLNASIEPNDELQLVLEDTPSSAQISAGLITGLQDSTPDSLRGATLYTSQSQEGIEAANDQSPKGKDLCLYKNMNIVANVAEIASISVTLLSIGGLHGLGVPVSFTADTTITSPILLTVSSTTGLHVGQHVTGTGIPANTYILSIDSSVQITLTNAATATGSTIALTSTDEIVIDGITYKGAATENIGAAEFDVYTSGTPSQNIALTAQSLVRVINRHTSNTTIYADYASNYEQLPGRLIFRARSLDKTSFVVTSHTDPLAWSPVLSGGFTVVQPTKRNRFFVSKLQRNEAFPLAQYFDVGSGTAEIYRVLSLRDSFIICKQDGFWRVTGDSPSSLQVEPLDLTTQVVAPESMQAIGNAIYGLVSQGFAQVTDTGVGIISNPSIQDQVNRTLQLIGLDSELLLNSCFGVGFADESSYLCWTPSDDDFSVINKIFRYNIFTSEWTKHEKEASAANIFNSQGVKAIVLNNPDFPGVIFSQIRSKNPFGFGVSLVSTPINFYPTADNVLPLYISSIDSATQITAVAPTPYYNMAGFELWQNGVKTVIQVSNVVSLNVVLTVEDSTGFEINEYAYAGNSIEYIASFTPQTCGNPANMKQVREAQFLFDSCFFDAAFAEFSTDITPVVETVDLTGDGLNSWGDFPFGDAEWGGVVEGDWSNNKGRVLIPKDHQRASWINSTFRVDEFFAQFELSGIEYTYTPMSERSQKSNG